MGKKWTAIGSAVGRIFKWRMRIESYRPHRPYYLIAFTKLSNC